MQRLRHHSVIKFILFWVLTSFAAPTVVELHHVLEDEVHEVCTAHDEFHFHEIHHDCEFKIKLHPTLLIEFTNEFLLYTDECHLQPLNLYEYFQSTSLLTSFVRGPPQMVYS